MMIPASVSCAASPKAAAAPVLNDKVAFGPQPAWANPPEPRLTPSDAQGMIYVERQDLEYHLDGRGESQFQTFRYKILQPQALDVGTLALTWNPAGGSATVHKVSILRDGQTIDILDKAKFEVLGRENNLEQSMLDGTLTAILHVPDLRVGDVLEAAFTLRLADATLAGDTAGIWAIAPSPSRGLFSMAVSWDEGQKPNFAIAPALSNSVTRSADSMRLTLVDPPSMPPPADAPGRFEYQRFVEYSDYPDWWSVGAKFHPLFEAAAKLAPDSPLRAEADRIKAGFADEAERAAAALKLVQQQVRYVYVGLGAGNLTPANADVTWQRRYGDCKGKTALLLALLRYMGIAAEPVLVNLQGFDDGMDQRLPNPALFDHVVVRATIGGKNLWMDGTLPPVALASERPMQDYRFYLPLTNPPTTLQRAIWTPYAAPQLVVTHDLDARAGFDTPAKVAMTTVTRGMAGLKEYAAFSAATPEQLTTTLKSQLSGGFFTSVDTVQWRYDAQSAASILSITGTTVLDWDDEGNGGKSLTLPGGGFNPPNRRTRDAQQDQKAPYAVDPEYACHVTTLRVPTTTKDSDWHRNESFADMMFGRIYYRNMSQQDGTIRLVRGSRSLLGEISAADAAKDNARIPQFDNSMARVEYVPGTKRASPTGSRFGVVPPAWDPDWARSGAACQLPTVSSGTEETSGPTAVLVPMRQ